MKYVRRDETVTAQQWEGDIEKIDIAEIRQVEGMTGYQGKLAYYDTPEGKTATIRPKDYIVKKQDESIDIMSSVDFEKTYREVANSKKSANNNSQSKNPQDNFIKA